MSIAAKVKQAAVNKHCNPELEQQQPNLEQGTGDEGLFAKQWNMMRA